MLPCVDSSLLVPQRRKMCPGGPSLDPVSKPAGSFVLEEEEMCGANNEGWRDDNYHRPEETDASDEAQPRKQTRQKGSDNPWHPPQIQTEDAPFGLGSGVRDGLAKRNVRNHGSRLSQLAVC